MATGSLSSVPKRFLMVEDFSCTCCLEQNLTESADIYCEQCLRFYCKKCVILHSQLFTKHMTCGREDIKKWPVSKAVEDFLRKCEVHEDETLTQFCHDHSQLCCSACVGTIHSQCSKVTQISELTNTQPSGLEGLSVELETVLGEIKTLQISQEASIQSLQRTYNEHREVMIEQMCGNLNTYIDECDNNSVGTSGGNEQYLKEEICRNVVSIVNEFDNITAKELNEMKDEVISIKGSVTSSIHKCTSVHNDLSQFHEIVPKIGDHKQLCLIASIKCKHIIQQALTLLGKSGKAFNVQSNTKHNVRIPSDSDKCLITGICVLTDGQVLVADRRNERFKLLNQQYQVVSHCGVAEYVRDMCQITPSVVAVAVDDYNNTHNVQFITVTQSQLTLGRKLELQHGCTGITCHQGDLFICSGTALFKYTLYGKQVCRLYEDRSSVNTVEKCAVSPTGDRLYITNCSHDKLHTLARDGTLLATYTDPALRDPFGVHVTPAGQVLVCGNYSDTVQQVGWEGQSKLATLARREDGVRSPWSVFYSSTTSSIIVGQLGRDNILVFRVE
ncbi:uncharacterized protein LOC127875237 [Dreissena polymorpha]|uniref:B box-type domain-containing protein n=1 Tax=Dreissena polymorpha TaxID=45954 RepID=A0A9D4RUL0_DREPO|nr:uncharacterized protein LOC127875237 [Dreissena polymorpha]XP_052276084.1 uncharacterized protein LOC127875237 [Dreissena polymorpha]XP_052276094.1 uncharacterized protein LOC127875237 [Dreissena polymorpha]XP_052276104.1 uncharacterized protein LOC127875237 [Dreissena polymorpha]XP_052276112.1 uncharacterized protein LOC127875237 [Dreissena polymorpha]XP_052276121.1 uncharacterized protein LOC127875237 [Dreissena polymorpha]XP_052276132.1 uncharacterized protein LOC127875237 [Dreissena po